MDNTETKKEINKTKGRPRKHPIPEGRKAPAGGIHVKREYLEIIAKDAALQGRIAKNCNKSWITIYRWVVANDEKLTMLSVLKAIREHLNLPADTELTEEL